MLRVLILAVAVLCPPLAAVAQEVPRVAPRPLASAFDAMRAGRWDVAARLALRDGPAAAALIEWYRLRAGRGTPREIMDFLDSHWHWPGLPLLRRESEEAMTHAGFDDVLDFYQDDAPRTGTGVLNHARALVARGQVGAAEAGVVLAWRTMDLTEAEHAAFLDAHGGLLAPHHAARLDMALWRGLRDVALMLPLVPEVARERAEIRQRIEDGRGEVDDLLRALPPDARSAPGIAHAVFNRHIAEGESDRAIEVILRQSRIAGGLGRAERWSGWRRALARAEMRRGNAETAYELAAFHQLSAGARFADLEWLAGYVALRYLDAPGLALDHFQRLRSAVQTPISLGRAGYWMGRALDAAGDPAAARDAYLLGAEHPTSFYGILAAEEGGVSLDGIPSGPQRGVDWRAAAFTDSDLYKVGVLALSMGRLTLAERFFVRLSETLGPDDLALMGAMLEELEQPHLQVMVGKAAARRGLVVPAPYYALHPLTEGDLPVPEELVLAIARRESEFDPGVVSGAGAEGLMQLMPGTAREVAVGMGLDHAPGRMLSDWRYNADLGAGYLAGLAERFGGNIVMISAGYNAGPARPPRWMELYGDPRGRGVDVIDWIEHIPFRETRNYVMRVAESLPVYRARLGRTPLPVPFSEELAGATIRVRGQ